jgi:AcrR family transcriptional regulator
MATKRSVSSTSDRPEPKRPKRSSDDTSSAADAPRRRYRSDRRDRQAAETRRDVLAAAVELFGERGWAGTTMAAIAAEAGVAVETVYSGFGSKKALLREAVDVSVVGDAEPIPLAERPEYRRIAEGSRGERMQTGIDLLATIHARTAPLWAALLEAGAGDPEVAAWCHESEERRRAELVNSLQLILGAPLDEATIDLAWALFSTEVYTKLVRERGWSDDAYRDAMLRVSALLTADVPPAG